MSTEDLNARKSTGQYHKRTRRKQRRRTVLTDYVQDFLPIKAITKDGVIETTDHRYVMILEVEPINFLLRSARDQSDIIYSFQQWFKIANVRVQFKAITRPANSEHYIQKLREDMQKEPNKATRRLATHYIQLIRNVGGDEALTRNFYLIFEYESHSDVEKKATYNNIYNTLEQAALAAKQYFGKCGNKIVPYGDFPDRDVKKMLYNIFNRSSYNQTTWIRMSSGQLQKVVDDFNTREDRVGKDTRRAAGITSDISALDLNALDLVSPRGIDLTHVNYTIMDGLYYTYLYIKPDGYKKDVINGWVSNIIMSYPGVDVDIFFTKIDKSAVQEKLSRRIILNSAKFNTTNATDTDYEEVRDAITSGYYIKNSLAAGDDLYYMSIIISINDTTLKGLKYKTAQMKNYLKSLDLRVGDFRFQQEEAFMSTLPLCNINKDVERKIHRNVLSGGAASTYMFTAYEMKDENGILLGVSPHNSSMCIIDIFNTKEYKNANMCILGTSGSGKTFTEQIMALRMRMRGIQCFIIAPLKGHEFRRACEAIGGTYVKISPSSNNCINILGIRPTDSSFDKELEGEAYEDPSFLNKKIDQVHIFMRLLIPDMTDIEETLLDEALVTIYATKGITDDNDSLYKADGTLKEMPILGELQQELLSKAETRRLSTILTRFVTGSAQTFNQQTNVDLDNKYIVLDISELKGTMLPIGMFIALDYVWDKAKEDRTRKKAIFLDETWNLLRDNPFSANFVLEVFKIIRGYGGSAIAATQDLEDFFALEDGKYGKGIINNAKTKIILNIEQEEAKAVRDSMDLSDAEVQQVTHAERGYALICANNNHITVNVRASEYEKDLVTTDAGELLIAKERLSDSRQQNA